MPHRSIKASKRRSIACLSVAAVLIALCASAGSARASTLWRGDYESGNLKQWSAAQALPGRATVGTTLVRQGTYSARFEVRPGDDPIGASGERAELWKTTGEQAGTESWWAWSTYFGSDFRPNPSSHWNIFTQWHNTGSSGQANAHFEIDTAVSPWKIQLRTYGGQQDKNERRFDLANLEQNRWLDFVFHVRWATDSSGFVEVWLNGAHVLPKTFTPTIYAGQAVYLKQGFYRGSYSSTTVVYHDGMRRGQSFADVTAPPADPPPDPDPDPGVEPPPDDTGEASEVTFGGRPLLLSRKRIRVVAAAEPGTEVALVVRGRYGWLLASSETIADEAGQATFVERMPRWRRGRMLRVFLGNASTVTDASTALKVPAGRRPSLLPGKRIRAAARAQAGSQVTMVVRNRFGRILAMAEKTADAYGRVTFLESMPRWRGRRLLRVTLAAPCGDHSCRTLIPLKVSRHARLLSYGR